MQQTALNLAAIGIFVMTFSTLVGPALHLSPVIPAATTLGILGLATLDTFTWQGKGSTLLLARFSSPQQRKRIVHHEAGHFLAAWVLGIPITGYTLSAWEAFRQGQSGLGGVQLDTQLLATPASKVTEIPRLLAQFSTVWMAGIAAEKLVYGEAEGGESDRQQLREALQLAGLPANIHSQKERWALLQAKSLLEQNWQAYEPLVEAMEKRVSVEECCRIIQQTTT
jgi:hypothetical protein